MNEVTKILSENHTQYMATVGRDGKAKVRPFAFCFEMDGKLWFGTNSTKEVYKDMQANPYVELAVVTADMKTLRLSGKATFVDDRSVKEAMMNIPTIKMQYQTADNPILEVFYLEEAHAIIAEITGAVQEYNL